MAASPATRAIYCEKSVRRIILSISLVTLADIILFRVFILGDVVITAGSFTQLLCYYLIARVYFNEFDVMEHHHSHLTGERVRYRLISDRGSLRLGSDRELKVPTSISRLQQQTALAGPSSLICPQMLTGGCGPGAGLSGQGRIF